jgi:competence protein ComEC
LRWLFPALAAAHALGLGVGDAARASAEAWLWLALHAAALGAVFARARVLGALVVAFAAGAFALALRIEAARETRLARPVEAVVEARVAAVEHGAGGATLELREVVAVEPRGQPLPDALLLHAEQSEGLAALRRGSWLRAALRIAPAPGRKNPGGPDRARSLARRGLGATATPSHPELHALLEGARPGPLDPLAEFRRRGARRLAAEGPGGGLLAALGLGEAAALAPEPRAALARLGLSHLVAVSGLHLCLVAAPLYLAAAALARRSAALAARHDSRRLALAVAVAGSALYALLTGFAAPVQRALAFLGLLALAQLARRPLAPASAFGAAALAVATIDPAAVFAPGVQLSFAATAALVWSAPQRARAGPERGLARLVAALGLALRSSASATAATAPLVALHFGTVSPLGWLANALAVPLTSLLLLPLALASGLAAGAFPEAGGGLGAALSAAARLAAALLDACVALAAHVPARLGVVPGAFGIAASCALALACVRARASAARLVFAGLAAAAPAWGPPPRLDPAPPRVVHLDVGQGDAAIVQGRRAAVLVDGGTALDADGARRFDAGERVVLPALGALGVRRLDLVIASHADLDHRGGLPAVLRALPVGSLWLPPGGRADPAFRELLDAAAARGVSVAERAAGEAPLALGDLAVEALWPPRVGGPAERNDASLVVRVEVGRQRALFAGDLEQAGERRLLAARAGALRAELLKLGHHGSRTSSSSAFLAAVAPRLAVVSAPRHGRFGMPHAEVLERLRAAGVPWHWTGRDGAVLVGLAPVPRTRGFAGVGRESQAEPGSPR